MCQYHYSPNISPYPHGGICTICIICVEGDIVVATGGCKSWHGRVLLSLREGVSVTTPGYGSSHDRVLARSREGVGTSTPGCWPHQHPGLSHINTRVLRRKKGGVGTPPVYHWFSRGIFLETTDNNIFPTYIICIYPMVSYPTYRRAAARLYHAADFTRRIQPLHIYNIMYISAL